MKFALLLLLACVMLCPAANAQEHGDPVAGRAYAEEICARCHAVAPGDTYSPKVDATSFETIANTPGMSVIALSVFMQTPHPTMPNLVLKSDALTAAGLVVTCRDLIMFCSPSSGRFIRAVRVVQMKTPYS